MRISGIKGFVRSSGPRQSAVFPPGPFGLSEEYAEMTEDISRTGHHARVVFGD
ncbi:hypothetical protein [Streptomyces sp. NPDC001980]|uniref:hypothetical protein n=1 Tax=Streptomyces sp. NPDC001980 TaxID=3157126 RepID=UPI00331FE339